MSKQTTEPWIWWKHGVIYHIYPRSFQDSDGDGIGDIRGIIRRLGYLKELGIDGIWISPMYKSPMVDFGYDVSGYREIDPTFGTMEDFMELLRKAHDSGIRIILDMILNHTSDQHPWFIESSSSLYNPKRNWYIWKDPILGSPPNNWKSAVGGSAWKFHEQSGQYYLHSFFEEQPDLNWRDAELPNVFFEEMKFWLDLGVDGFRLDVINMIAKDKKFRSNPVAFGIQAFQKHIYTRNRKRSVTVVKQIRELLDRYDDRVSIGEIYAQPPGDAKTAAKYLAKGKDGLHLTFDFSLIFTTWNAHSYFKSIKTWHDSIPKGGWPCNVLSNHDLFRSIDRFPWRTNREEKAKVAATLLLTLMGTPFIYYGEEIGMHNAHIAKSQIRDPIGKRFWPLFNGRDKARTPMQWVPETKEGFTTGNPWLPLNKDTRLRNVRQQEGEPSSLLNLYRNLIKVRKTSEALQKGSWLPINNGQDGILAYLRNTENERILVILNFLGRQKTLSLQEHTYGKILFSTHQSQDDFNYFQKMQISPFEASIYQVIE
ncbi:MAG: alpha-glucosidase [Bacteroidales bacterium]|nr:alpha-glucosidase [Bacteroidales bacterium]